MLCDVSSMNSTARIAHVSANKVAKFLNGARKACERFRNHEMRLRPLQTPSVQSDLVLCRRKKKTYPAPRPPRKAPDTNGHAAPWMPIQNSLSFMLVGNGGASYANKFMQEVSDKLITRFQLTAGCLRTYFEGLDGKDEAAFDSAALIKHCG